jgi:hypothetical protein
MKLYTGWDKETQDAVPEAIRQAIAQAWSFPIDPFLILISDDHWYLQAKRTMRGLIIEKREGSSQHHYRGVHVGRNGDARSLPEIWDELIRVGPRRVRHFLPEEVSEVFLAHAQSLRDPVFIGWESMTV